MVGTVGEREAWGGWCHEAHGWENGAPRVPVVAAGAEEGWRRVVGFGGLEARGEDGV